MNIFQFDEKYFDSDFSNMESLGKLNFWYWMLEQQTKKGFLLLPPFINYICNTNEEPPTMLVFDENTDDDGDGVTD